MANIRPQQTVADPNQDEISQRLEKRRRKHRRHPRRFRNARRLIGRIRWQMVLIITVATLMIVGVTALVLVTDSLEQLDRSQESLNRVVTTLNNKPADEWTYADFERLQSSVSDLLRSLDRVDQRTFFLRPIAGLNSDWEASFTILDATKQVSLAASNMLNGLDPTLFFLTEGQRESAVSQISSGDRTVELLTLGRSQFLSANNYLDSAERYLHELDRATLSKDLLLTVEDLEDYYELGRDMNNTLLQAPDLLTAMLGLDATKTYLILSQNNDEIRPSGGYISTYGWMTVRNSRILDYVYRPVGPNSPLPPPADMAAELTVPDWWIQYSQPIYTAWDASWYADFPTTADMAAWFFDNGNNLQQPVDGVIAIDILAVEYLLEALDTVFVPGYDEFVTGANFRDVIYRIRAEGQGELEHKQFLAALYAQILFDWQNLEQDKKSAVLGAQLRALREKHIMLYFRDEDLNAALTTLGWSGAQDPGLAHDYIMIVDANMSANKSNHSIQRQLTYDVEIMPDSTLTSRTTISYDYPDSVARDDPAVHPAHYRNIDYVNRLQVFTPLGSVLLATNDVASSVQQIEDTTHTIFTSLVIVEYNSGERLQFSYTTPTLIEEFGSYRRYRLLLQKQPGTAGDPVNIQVRLPAGASLIVANPEPEATFTLEQPILEFRLTLVRDEWVEIIYRQ